MAKATHTAPLVVIADQDAEASYVTSRLIRELEERSSNLVLLPVSEAVREAVEESDGTHPLCFVINHCISFVVNLLLVAENTEVAKAVKAWVDGESGLVISEYPSVSVQTASRSQTSLELALSLAKAEKGAVEFFGVEKEALNLIKASKLPYTHWGRRARGRRAETAEGPPTSLIDHLADAVSARVLDAVAPQLASIVDAVEANGIEGLRKWLEPQAGGEARPVRIRPSRQAVKAS